MDSIRNNIIYEILTDCANSVLNSTDSSSTSESEEENILMENFSKRAKIKGYVSMVIPKYTNHQFQEHFRISRESVEVT